MLQMRLSSSPAPEALTSALGIEKAEDSGLAGPSTDDTPQILRVVHVLDDEVPYTRTRAAAAGMVVVVVAACVWLCRHMMFACHPHVCLFRVQRREASVQCRRRRHSVVPTASGVELLLLQ